LKKELGTPPANIAKKQKNVGGAVNKNFDIEKGARAMGEKEAIKPLKDTKKNQAPSELFSK